MKKPTNTALNISKSAPSNSSKSVFSQQVGQTANRKLRAQRHNYKLVWAGLGMMGLIGWSVAIPTMVGALIGIWLDKDYPTAYSWTLTLLLAGLCLGCATAWRWVAQEDQDIHKFEGNDDAD